MTKLYIVILLLFIKVPYSKSNTDKIIDAYNMRCEKIFNKKKFSNLLNEIDTLTYKKSYLSSKVYSKIFTSSNFTIDSNQKKINEILFDNGTVNGKLIIYFIDELGMYFLKPVEFKSEIGFEKEVKGSFIFFRDSFYFLGKWPYAYGNKSKSYEKYSSIIKLDNSLNFQSFLQFDFSNILGEDFKYRYLRHKEGRVFYSKKHSLFEDKSFMFYLDILNNEIKQSDELLVLKSIELTKIWYLSGNVLFEKK